MYGSGLDAYSMLGAMINEGGLPPERLILVIPPTFSPAFPNHEVSTSVANHLDELAVRVVGEAELVTMKTDEQGQLSGIQLRTEIGVVTLPCAALVYMHDKQVDQHLFKGTPATHTVGTSYCGHPWDS